MRRITIDFVQDANAGKAGRFMVFINSEKDPKATSHENTICEMILPVVKAVVLKVMPAPTGIGHGKTMEESRVAADIMADIAEAGGKPEEEQNGGKTN